jgi:hypothetical protein
MAAESEMGPGQVRRPIHTLATETESLVPAGKVTIGPS